MSRYRVLLTDYAWADTDVERAALADCDAELLEAPATDEATLIQLAGGVDAIMVCWAQVTAAVIEAASQRRIVARLGIGLDNIDVACCTRLRVPVTNVPDYCATEVAEHALALLLSLARRTAMFHHQTMLGCYDLSAGLPIFRLEGRTVGVVGLGLSGGRFAEKCLALGFHVLAVRGPGHSMPGVEFVEWDELLTRSDFVSLHAPLTVQTECMIDERALALMKPTAFLINTARGGLVDPQALAAALRANRLAGAGLDVQIPEPPDLGTAPWNDPRVLVTPHAAFVSEQSVTELRRRTSAQVRDALLGRRPANVVNGEIYSP